MSEEQPNQVTKVKSPGRVARGGGGGVGAGTSKTRMTQERPASQLKSRESYFKESSQLRSRVILLRSNHLALGYWN